MLSLSFVTLSAPPVHPERAAMIEVLKATPGISWKVEAQYGQHMLSNPCAEAC